MNERDLKKAAKAAFEKDPASKGITFRLVVYNLVVNRCAVLDAASGEILAVYSAAPASDSVTRLAIVDELHKRKIRDADK